MCRPERFDTGAVQHSGPFPTWNKRVERLREYSSLYWLKIVIFYMLQLYMKVGLIFTVYILQAVSVDRISAHSPFWYSTRGWYFILSFPGKFFVWEKLACCSNFWLSGDRISPAAARFPFKVTGARNSFSHPAHPVFGKGYTLYWAVPNPAVRCAALWTFPHLE